ncbi:hypothetical protein CAMRE0001_0077 [Campylobacter rectus RM3267]|uniref:Uncharacterized protein n=1 Tax=Campylobacter rectus RM3267 TaxID=553218 RepID=B9CXS2_CAMRE|nr:hypothetical protein CAMRE0001_0077 [Campylobacter rectus RM3267]
MQNKANSAKFAILPRLQNLGSFAKFRLEFKAKKGQNNKFDE